MLKRLIQGIRTAGQPKNVKIARKIAEIVAPSTALTLTFTELNYSALPAPLVIKLLGYLHGFSMVVCASWQIPDVSVPIGATVFAIETVFPQRRDNFVAMLTNDAFASSAFKAGGVSGRADGETFAFKGRSGIALLELLARDFKGYCNQSEIEAAISLRSLR